MLDPLFTMNTWKMNWSAISLSYRDLGEWIQSFSMAGAFILRSGYFAGHRLRYKNLFCRSLISQSCWTLGLGLGFGLGYRRMMDVRVRVWIRI